MYFAFILQKRSRQVLSVLVYFVFIGRCIQLASMNLYYVLLLSSIPLLPPTFLSTYEHNTFVFLGSSATFLNKTFSTIPITILVSNRPLTHQKMNVDLSRPINHSQATHRPDASNNKRQRLSNEESSSYIDKRCFESQIWKLKTSHSDRTFYIHEEVLKSASSVIYAVCGSSWAESQEYIYKFDEAVSEEVLSCFVSYAYRREYPVESPTTSAQKLLGSSSDKQGPNNDQGTHPLLLHAQIYVFADAYDVASFGDPAVTAIKSLLLDMADLNTDEKRERVLDLIDHAFDNVREDDPLLIFLADYAGYMLHKLRLSPRRLAASFSGSDGNFAKHLLPRLQSSSKNPFSADYTNSRDSKIKESLPSYEYNGLYYY